MPHRLRIGYSQSRLFLTQLPQGDNLSHRICGSDYCCAEFSAVCHLFESAGLAREFGCWGLPSSCSARTAVHSACWTLRGAKKHRPNTERCGCKQWRFPASRLRAGPRQGARNDVITKGFPEVKGR